ncbi:hypothetical protein K7X08_020087 [Anisodus acutangulus]|uniref:Uncharacterized protein n=1 Tax=Anisodus acutangulus TaxID=402998 RepID=A0A9Q1M5U4_9SOLA|nr:hypothetical protein K7X08_020087 [Anisodus acutangulus]
MHFRKTCAALQIDANNSNNLLNEPVTSSKSSVKDGQYVTLVQSGARPICHGKSTHHIQISTTRNGGPRN